MKIVNNKTGSRFEIQLIHYYEELPGKQGVLFIYTVVLLVQSLYLESRTRTTTPNT